MFDTSFSAAAKKHPDMDMDMVLAVGKASKLHLKLYTGSLTLFQPLFWKTITDS